MTPLERRRPFLKCSPYSIKNWIRLYQGTPFRKLRSSSQILIFEPLALPKDNPGSRRLTIYWMVWSLDPQRNDILFYRGFTSSTILEDLTSQDIFCHVSPNVGILIKNEISHLLHQGSFFPLKVVKHPFLEKLSTTLLAFQFGYLEDHPRME